MEVLYFCWFGLGVFALFASSAKKRSIIGMLMRELGKVDKVGDILMTLFAVVIVCPCVIAVGPITLIRFVVDFD